MIVVCPNFDGIFGPCVVKNTSCIVTATCPPGKLCCSKGCGKECVEPGNVPSFLAPTSLLI